MVRQLLFVLVAVFALVSQNSFAHQQKAAETTVLFNKRSGHLEVMHRFYLHDTEHAVQALFDKHADILDSKQTQQQFADYVAKQFLAKSLSDKPLTMSSVGFEVDGKFFWVYQETKLPKDLKGIKLYNGALRDLWPTQINMVNIEGRGQVRTLYFSDNKDWLTVTF
ncbi:hypothetical protein J7384_09445 [Endozoicomonas sp. G2_1]|uniref:DUF6702 family protein n=1 Tax=Endozoicomonas sp. G2_1 TaxID=2821091 RepID=UPI001ADBC92A|nr:DUF6702 family protein [Endozoicomonas sp. G2_1]MBO9490587.1 hypothetical protein [Endozoicomonas sp. G2_1]